MARMTISEAVAIVRPTDTLAVPLGPGVPGGFMHALGDRDDYVDLQISGALMPDLYAVLAKPGVHYRSGFFGPAERFLRDSGASIDFVDTIEKQGFTIDNPNAGGSCACGDSFN